MIAALATLVVAYLPERRARPALYLLPGGVAVTALLTLAMVVFGPPSFRGGSEFDPSLLERSVLTLVVLVWPALGALVAFGRWMLAIMLAILVADVVMVAQAPLAMAAFMLGALAFAATGETPRRVATRRRDRLFCGLVAIAPALPFALAPLAAKIPMVGRSTLAAMTDWRGLVADDPARLVTGHGLDLARYGVVPISVSAVAHAALDPVRALVRSRPDRRRGVRRPCSRSGCSPPPVRRASSRRPFSPGSWRRCRSRCSASRRPNCGSSPWPACRRSPSGCSARSSRGDRPAAASLETLPAVADAGAMIAARAHATYVTRKRLPAEQFQA